MGPLIEIKDLTSSSDDGRKIFEGASLALSGGEKVLVTAPVSAGKSLLLKLIAGLVRPEGGVVRVFGEDIANLSGDGLKSIRKRMGFVFQDTTLISNLKVIENVALPMQYHTEISYASSMERARLLLEEAGFTGDLWALPGPLPLFAKKEVAAARALSLEPEIILCENITDGLTEFEKERVASFILGYHASGGKLLILTSNTGDEETFFRPGRMVRIEGRRLVERNAD
ncbi:MAG: ATP-binding cassette domain-containing protein [Deltaproteobacteria bacterium]|nr:ATP-binding cassette domain-containing protein [Deltaproteobacteria bacterium]